MYEKIDRKGLFASLLTIPAWGLTGVLVKLLPGLSPFFVTSGRLLLAAVAMTPLLVFSRSLRYPVRRAMYEPAAWGLAGLFVLYYITAVAAYQLAPVGETSLSLSTSPVFSLLILRMRGHTVRRQEIRGALLAVVGVLTVVLPGLTFDEANAMERLVGHALALTCSLSAAVYTDWFRLLGQRGDAPDATAVSLITFVMGGLLLAFVVGIIGDLPGRSLSAHSWGVFGMLAIVSTALPTVAYGVSSSRLPAVLTTTLRLFIPVFAASLAALILGEVPSVWVLPGGALIVAGVLHMMYAGRKAAATGGSS